VRKGALAAERILVNAVAPGACATGFTKGGVSASRPVPLVALINPTPRIPQRGHASAALAALCVMML
jgi:hypothetical protein